MSSSKPIKFKDVQLKLGLPYKDQAQEDMPVFTRMALVYTGWKGQVLFTF